MKSPLTALIVEDSPDDAELTVRELGRTYEVDWERVATAREMQAALGRRAIELVISDYTMPGFGAAEALAVLQRSGQDIPFIIVSGTIGEDTAVAAMKAGAHDYLIKDNLRRLGAAVARELREAEVRREHRWSAQALSFLAEASLLLAEWVDPAATLERVARLAVPLLGDVCVIAVAGEDRGFAPVALAHVDRQQEEALRPPLAACLDAAPSAHLAAVAFRTGKVQRLGRGEADGAAARDACDEFARALGPRTELSVPLLARGRVLGGMSLCALGARPAAGKAPLAVAEEIAHRIALAVDNARLLAATERARGLAEEALRARDEFLSVASHELRTPLTPLYLDVEALARSAARGQVSGDPALRERIERARASTERLTALVDNMLDVARIAGGWLALERERFDLGELVRQVAAQFKEQLLQVGSPLVVQTDAPLVGCWDRGRAEQILTNLLTNAMKFGHGRPVELRTESADDRARLVVRDHGIGIAPADAERIFERFARGVSAEHYGGLGLGLYITKQIVEAHGGRIRVDSQPGLGATFTVELPLLPVRSTSS